MITKINVKRLLSTIITRYMSDKQYLKFRYKRAIKKDLNLNNPESFNEKLQWLKLYDKNLRYTDLVDKYEVRKYIEKAIGEKYLIPILGVWNSTDDIKFEDLPEKFVLKTTHDSGGVIVCQNKDDLDIKNVKNFLKKHLKNNYYYSCREWPYKNVHPRIIAEKYMVDESGKELKDYKVFTFSGKAKYIQVDYDRFVDHHRNFYDTQWNYIPFTTLYPTNPNHIIDKPVCLNELVDLSEKLAQFIGSPSFLRLDFYVINEKIYFGEITFYHGAGFEKFYPEEYDRILGNMIDLKVNKV